MAPSSGGVLHVAWRSDAPHVAYTSTLRRQGQGGENRADPDVCRGFFARQERLRRIEDVGRGSPDFLRATTVSVRLRFSAVATRRETTVLPVRKTSLSQSTATRD